MSTRRTVCDPPAWMIAQQTHRYADAQPVLRCPGFGEARADNEPREQPAEREVVLYLK